MIKNNKLDSLDNEINSLKIKLINQINFYFSNNEDIYLDEPSIMPISEKGIIMIDNNGIIAVYDFEEFDLSYEDMAIEDIKIVIDEINKHITNN